MCRVSRRPFGHAKRFSDNSNDSCDDTNREDAMAGTRVGFIGVGLMGHGMAKNILAKGFPLAVMGHRNRAPVEDLVSRGATEVKTPAEMAAQCDVIVLCVTGAPQVDEVLNGENGILKSAKAGLHIIDTSTSEPTLTMALAAKLAQDGIFLCDAPLGGTPIQAEEGALSAMVGADDAAFAVIEPVVAAFASRIVRVGAPGAGHTMKLLNNFLSLGYGAIYAEALAIAGKVGVTAEVFDSVIRGSRMDCGFYQTFMGYVLDANVNAHRFTITNAHKDMRYVTNLATNTGASAFISATVKNLYAAAEGLGNGGKNVPQITDVLAQMNGLPTVLELKAAAE
ncbi:NAD(P)-dependent oxidoreductase [Xanthobacter aminoxidans]|uniref:NAD(P)-dependent oxidoreductase n=1 Tax=Xanthobacter aminoxidans TaxID=186280 RepID=UPI00372B3996